MKEEIYFELLRNLIAMAGFSIIIVPLRPKVNDALSCLVEFTFECVLFFFLQTLLITFPVHIYVWQVVARCGWHASICCILNDLVGWSLLNFNTVTLEKFQ